MPALVEYLRDAPAPVGFLELGEHRAHFDGELGSAGRRRGDRGHLLAPVVKRRAGHSQDRTHPPDRIAGLLRFNQRAALSYGRVLAKKAAAFFRNSFSIRSLRISSSISARRARSRGLNAFSGSGFSAFH